MKLKDIQDAMLASFEHNDFSYVADIITDSEALSAKARWKIYQGSIQALFTRALSETFPVCHALVGDACFNALGAYYQQHHTSTSPDLGDYGINFADCVEKLLLTEPNLAGVPYLADMARLEWAWHIAFHSAQAKALDATRLSIIDEDMQGDIRFKLSPQIILLMSDYPITKIWAWHQAPTSDAPSFDNAKTHCIIWRPERDVIIEEVSEDMWHQLYALKTGYTLADMCERWPDIDHSLPLLCQRGIITDFTI